jgi:hypothetical protein
MKRRYSALVIGNGAYSEVSPLANPTNDADDIAAILEKRDFAIIKKTDCTHKDGRRDERVRDRIEGRRRWAVLFRGTRDADLGRELPGSS